MSSSEEQVNIGEYCYVSKPDHRDGTRSKSQWRISLNDEYASFALGTSSTWIAGQFAWGLHLVNNIADYLGSSAVDPGPDVALCVAFFQLAVPCHGYPSDPKRSTREVPPNEVRNDWLAKKYLRPAAIRKIGRGLTCKL